MATITVMKKTNSWILLGAVIIGLSACGKPLADEFDGKFSNGGASATYYLNGQPVHSENYGKSGFGIVNCVYSQKHDKFSLDMYVPEKSDVVSFGGASEGVFLQVYGNKGMPTNITIGINGNQKSTVNAMLPANVVQSSHHFGTINPNAHCNFSIRQAGSTYDGTINCFKLSSDEVAGSLDIKTSFQCDNISNY